MRECFNFPRVYSIKALKIQVSSLSHSLSNNRIAYGCKWNFLRKRERVRETIYILIFMTQFFSHSQFVPPFSLPPSHKHVMRINFEVFFIIHSWKIKHWTKKRDKWEENDYASEREKDTERIYCGFLLYLLCRLTANTLARVTEWIKRRMITEETNEREKTIFCSHFTISYPISLCFCCYRKPSNVIKFPPSFTFNKSQIANMLELRVHRFSMPHIL